MTEYTRIDLSISVSGNVGFTTTNIHGKIYLVCIAPPGSGSYDYNITDTVINSTGSVTVGIIGDTSLSGDHTDVVEIPCTGQQTITILNAGNGTYGVSLYYEPGL